MNFCLFADKDYVTKLVEAERARLDLDSSIQTATDVSKERVVIGHVYFRGLITSTSLEERNLGIEPYEAFDGENC